MRAARDWCDLHDVVASAAAHLHSRPSDRVRAARRPAAGPCRRRAARAGVLEPARERGQVLAAGVAGPDQRRHGLGRVTVRVTDQGRGIPQHRARARVRAVLPRPRRVWPAPGWAWRSRRGFVEANGGRILLQTGSRPRNVVRGQLPGRAPARCRRRDERLGPPRVLVVDDEPQIVRGLKIMLRNAGYAVEAAETKAQALASLAVRPPDALVLDLVLPDGEGIEVCREVRRSAGCRSWCCRRSATSARRSARSTRAPTTT